MSLRRNITFSASMAVIGMAVAMASVPAGTARAEEGMWTFDNFPMQGVNPLCAFRDARLRLCRVKA